MNRRRFLLRAAGLLSAIPYRGWATPVASGWLRLRLTDAHTGATFDGAYRDANGPIARVMDELCVFFARPVFRPNDQHRCRRHRLSCECHGRYGGRTAPSFYRPFAHKKPMRCWPALPSALQKTASIFTAA